MTEEPTRGISRRTLAKGVAWSVPAVAVASAVPAFAASPPEPPPVNLTGRSCKIPGGSANGEWNDGSVYETVLTNTTGTAQVFEITGFRRGTASQDGDQVAVVKLSTLPASVACCTNLVNPAGTFTVPANSTGTYAFVTRNWGSSGSGALVVEFEIDGIPQPDATGSDGALNPIPNCNGQGGSCALTEVQKACIMNAVVPSCNPANAACS